jgi:hypothetical protein
VFIRDALRKTIAIFVPMKQTITLICCLFLGQIAAFGQFLPELPIPIESDNYYEICQQLDAYFAEEYHEADDTDCWDNERVKYLRWQWLWRNRVLPDGTFPDMGTQWLDYRKGRAPLGMSISVNPRWPMQSSIGSPQMPTELNSKGKV